MKKTTAYKCDYCNKISLYKANIKRHEKQCTSDPSNCSCKTCANLIDYESPWLACEVEYVKCNLPASFEFQRHCPMWTERKL